MIPIFVHTKDFDSIESRAIPSTAVDGQLVKMAGVVDCSHATRMYGNKWMRGWTSKAERPGYEEWLFVAWVWGVEKFLESCLGRQ